MVKTSFLLFVAACGWLPPDSPPQKPVPPDPDRAAIEHTWVVDNHALGGNPNLSDREASELHGRKIVITATEFKSPWQGSCDDATRTKHERAAAEIAMTNDLVGDAWATVARFGIGPRATEYALDCTTKSTRRTPPLTIYITGKHAMTCFSGVCYLLSRSE